MPPDFKEHDNIDRDVIKVSRDTLRLMLEKGKEYHSAVGRIGSVGGLGVTLLFAALLTEKFRDFFFIPGETIRAVCVFGGIACLCLAARNVHKWLKEKGKYEPEGVVDGLLNRETKPTLALPEPQKFLTATKKRVRKIISPPFPQKKGTGI